LILFNLG